ncbi:MAG: HIT family protein [Planctomycetota bacterium]|nr:HIT family protein [Planctomycetota bacterium]
MPSLFSKIVAGEIPCAKAWENEEFLAFLDIMPVTPGHTLVIPKAEVDYLFDIADPQYQRLMLACKTVAGKLKAATGCRRVVMGVWGFEVPHAHVHLIPMNDLGEFPFPKREKAAPEALKAMAAKIASA